MRLPYLGKTPLPPTRDAMLAHTVEALGRDSPHGYLRARGNGSEYFLFFLEGSVHGAGELQGERFVARSILETVRALGAVSEAAFCWTELPLLLCVAVPFRKAPAAQVPLNLVDPETLLKSIQNTETDAVLVVRKGDARNLVFCGNGEPKALYVAAGEPFPKSGSIADRIVEYVLGKQSGPDVALDIYDQIQLPPSADAGRPLLSYLDDVSAPPPRYPATLTVLLSSREVFQYPITKDEIILGRGLDVDLGLDNLSVSRHHAKISRKGDTLVVEDLGTKNGITVNGKRVDKAVLAPGDDIGVGKYTLVYVAAAPTSENPDRTRLPGRRLAALAETMVVEPSGGAPVLRYGSNERKLDTLLTTIGNDDEANVKIGGWFIAPVHVQIVRNMDGTFKIRHVAGWRKLTVNGQKVREAALKVGDHFEVGKNRFMVRRE